MKETIHSIICARCCYIFQLKQRPKGNAPGFDMVTANHSNTDQL